MIAWWTAQKLYSTDHKVRFAAAQALATARDRRGVDALLWYIKAYDPFGLEGESPYSPKRRVKHAEGQYFLQACEQLAPLGNTEAIEILNQNLHVGLEEKVRALTYFGSSAAAQYLVKLVSHNKADWRGGEKELARIGAAAVPAILDNMAPLDGTHSSHARIVEAFSRVLEAIGEPAIAPTVNALPRVPEFGRWEVVRVITKLGWQPRTSQERTYMDAYEEHLRLEREHAIIEEKVKIVASDMSTNDQRTVAIRELFRLGQDKPECIRNWLDRSSPQARKEIPKILVEMKGHDAVSLLIGLLLASRGPTFDTPGASAIQNYLEELMVCCPSMISSSDLRCVLDSTRRNIQGYFAWIGELLERNYGELPGSPPVDVNYWECFCSCMEVELSSRGETI
jgi:hypothetical protein